MKLSIIIPTYNEAENIGRLVNYLQLNGGGSLAEIIVTDGGSSDKTLAIARAAGANARVSPKKGRPGQMNYGASLATGDVLYFIHADTFPPVSFVADITQALLDGYGFGRYISKYDSNRIMLKTNEFFTRFDFFIGYGGDQTFFIARPLFIQLQGFDTTMKIMEDFDLTARAKLVAKYKIIPKPVLISARKYNKNSWLRVQLANLRIARMFKKGVPQEVMAKKYKEWLDN